MVAVHRSLDGGTIDTGTLYHENMHQWWGDNVSESGYRMTFFKEGLATLAEFLYGARQDEQAAGGPSSPAGRAAFQASLVHQFNAIYGLRRIVLGGRAVEPGTVGLFSGSATYYRPGVAYIALRQILGHANFTRALEQIQRTYGGASISERRLEAVSASRLTVHSLAARARLGHFFTQWFDTAYAPGGGPHRPTITGPGTRRARLRGGGSGTLAVFSRIGGAAAGVAAGRSEIQSGLGSAFRWCTVTVRWCG